MIKQTDIATKLKSHAFLHVCLTVFIFIVCISDAYAQDRCLPGLPCALSIPQDASIAPLNPLEPYTSSVNSSSPGFDYTHITQGTYTNSRTHENYDSSSYAARTFLDPACDAAFMNQMYARAHQEAEREYLMLEGFVRKPDSVMEYTCFHQNVVLAAEWTPWIFSESQLWNYRDPDIAGGGYSKYMSVCLETDDHGGAGETFGGISFDGSSRRCGVDEPADGTIFEYWDLNYGATQDSCWYCTGDNAIDNDRIDCREREHDVGGFQRDENDRSDSDGEDNDRTNTNHQYDFAQISQCDVTNLGLMINMRHPNLEPTENHVGNSLGRTVLASLIRYLGMTPGAGNFGHAFLGGFTTSQLQTANLGDLSNMFVPSGSVDIDNLNVDGSPSIYPPICPNIRDEGDVGPGESGCEELDSYTIPSSALANRCLDNSSRGSMCPPNYSLSIDSNTSNSYLLVKPPWMPDLAPPPTVSQIYSDPFPGAPIYNEDIGEVTIAEQTYDRNNLPGGVTIPSFAIPGENNLSARSGINRYTCNLMRLVWNWAKCDNLLPYEFFSHVDLAMPDISSLPDKTPALDPRIYPSACPAAYASRRITPERLDIHFTATNNEIPDASLGNLVTSLRNGLPSELSTIANAIPTESIPTLNVWLPHTPMRFYFAPIDMREELETGRGSCGSPVPIGIQVIDVTRTPSVTEGRSTAIINTHEDHICYQPGCSYNPTTNRCVRR